MSAALSMERVGRLGVCYEESENEQGNGVWDTRFHQEEDENMANERTPKGSEVLSSFTRLLPSMVKPQKVINVVQGVYNMAFVASFNRSVVLWRYPGSEIDTVKLAASFGKLCTVPLDRILVHNVALQFFMDFMQQTGGQAHLFFWLTVEGYRVTAQQQLEVLRSRQRDGKHQTNQTKGLLRAAAVGVFDQYLSEKASPRVEIDDYLLARLEEGVNNEDPTPEIFDEVYDTMLRDDRFYPSFRHNALYIRMLAELDMLKEPSFKGSDDGDGESFNGSPTGSINLSLDDLSNVTTEELVQIHAYISDTGVCNEHGKTYA
ncbi:unnamed protein product, partial [Ranitomeya imitator]